ncbi:hypothetical protein IWW38_000916 [Coemansia aciculifera]|uniref:Uncharacterized protein n=1 Tax=Coemansia aciculifera TaxID=417176 RepID=A0ACC1M8M0_9FUNG|nr:hypothetical protein IWW38_000916 [Coemansia aciculifera]
MAAGGGGGGGPRTRAIIGLGLTLNPADAVVKLQPRTATRSLGSIKQRQAVRLSPPPPPPPPPPAENEKEDDGEAPASVGLSPGLSLFASPQPSLAPSEESQHAQSPLASDPQPVMLPASSPLASSPRPSSLPLPLPLPSPLPLPRLPQTPRTGAVREITCLLCFERVLVATGRSRGHALRCPSCLGALNKP